MPRLSTHGYIVVGPKRLTPLFPWARKRGPKAPWAQQKGWGGERKGEKRGGEGGERGRRGNVHAYLPLWVLQGPPSPPHYYYCWW